MNQIHKNDSPPAATPGPAATPRAARPRPDVRRTPPQPGYSLGYAIACVQMQALFGPYISERSAGQTE